MVGQVLNDRYQIEEKIGEGGMAVTYRAKDKMLGRTVAVKILREQYWHDAEFIERFRREAQSAGSLSHAHVAAVFDIGKHGDMPYIVMELVEGPNLQEVLRRLGTLPVERAVKIAEQVCDALSHAHGKGIVHRDIKPHNILLADGDRVKVTDFGIARALSADTLTKTHAIIGTVAYISPEQAQGTPTTPASDLYSLGIVLYEMLTGRVPFVGENPVAVALKHVSEMPVPPSQYRRDVPSSIEQVILRALSKSLSIRYTSAQDMQRDLQAASNGRHPSSLISHPSSPQPPLDPDHTQLIPRPTPVGAASEPERREPWMDRTAVHTRPSVSVSRSVNRAQPKTPWGKILAAVIFLGILVGGGASLMNTMNTGQSLVTTDTTLVPNLIGQDTTIGTRLLQQAGLHWGHKTLIPNESVPRGQILDQEPKPNVRAPKGANVNVTLSQGPPIQITSVPDVTEMSRNQAENRLREKNLKIGNVREEFSDHTPAGYVMSQSPQAGIRVEQGAQIDLVISKGTEPQPEATEPTIITSDEGKQATVKLTVPAAPPDSQRIKVVFRTENGDETDLYDASHAAGEAVEVPFEIPGSGEIRVFIEDNLVKSQKVQVGE